MSTQPNYLSTVEMATKPCLVRAFEAQETPKAQMTLSTSTKVALWFLAFAILGAAVGVPIAFHQPIFGAFLAAELIPLLIYKVLQHRIDEAHRKEEAAKELFPKLPEAIKNCTYTVDHRLKINGESVLTILPRSPYDKALALVIEKKGTNYYYIIWRRGNSDTIRLQAFGDNIEDAEEFLDEEFESFSCVLIGYQQGIEIIRPSHGCQVEEITDDETIHEELSRTSF